MNADTDRRRMEAIAGLGLLERAGDAGLTSLVRLASHIAGGGAGAVHVLSNNAQHRVAAVNAPLGEHPREDAMCRLVVDGDERVVCADATLEPRFAYTSFVRGAAPVRFYASVPVRLADGTVIGTLCVWDTEARTLSDEQIARLEDLAEHAAWRIELTRIAQEVGAAASHDPLTGVVNRLLLSDRLAQAFGRRLRHGGEVLVAVIDVDDFKAVNDTLGHEVGDEVLVAVARRLQGATRPEDTVARLGGDEFVVVAEVPDVDAAWSIIARIEASLAEPIRAGDALRPVGLTVGAALAEPGDEPRQAVARADREMYLRKPHAGAARRARPAPGAAVEAGATI